METFQIGRDLLLHKMPTQVICLVCIHKFIHMNEKRVVDQAKGDIALSTVFMNSNWLIEMLWFIQSEAYTRPNYALLEETDYLTCRAHKYLTHSIKALIKYLLVCVTGNGRYTHLSAKQTCIKKS